MVMAHGSLRPTRPYFNSGCAVVISWYTSASLTQRQFQVQVFSSNHLPCLPSSPPVCQVSPALSCRSTLCGTRNSPPRQQQPLSTCPCPAALGSDPPACPADNFRPSPLRTGGHPFSPRISRRGFPPFFPLRKARFLPHEVRGSILCASPCAGELTPIGRPQQQHPCGSSVNSPTTTYC